MPQVQPSQYLKLQDNQMLQRQLMLKQMQEHQRQQNYLNQQSENFIPANMNFMPHGSSASVQGFPNGIFSQPQMQGLFPTPSPDQLAESRSTAPLGRSTNSYNQHSHLQGLSSDSSITNAHSNQVENPTPQSLYGRPFFGNQMISSDLHSFTDGPFQSKQFPSGKNLFRQGTNEGFQQMNTSSVEFNSRQEQRGSYEQFQENTAKMDLSQGSTTLDPLEQKILFNVDGNSWSSFGSNTENYTNTFECSDYLSSFPSIQSGSMSALMQSAVDESSSDDGVVQEEWSGLSFPKTDLSMDNQPSMNVDVGNQQTEWVDNNVPSPLNGKPEAPFGCTNTSPGFSEFQFPNKHREGTRSDSSHESVQQSPRVGAKWMDSNSEQGQPDNGSQPNHATQSPFGNAFPFQSFQFSGGNVDQRSIFAKSHDQTYIQPSIRSSMQGNQNKISAAGQVNIRNQEQQHSSVAAVETQSPQATSHNVANKLPPFDLFIPQSTSQSSFSLDRVGQQFSILESVSVESSRKPPNPWPNASPQTLPSVTRPGELRLSSSDSMNTNLQVPPWVVQDRHGQQNFERNLSHEPSAGLTNRQGLLDGKEDHDKMSAYQKNFSEGFCQTTLPTGLYHGQEPVGKHLPGETGVGSGTLMGHPQQMNFDSLHGDKQVLSVSARDFEAFGRSLKPSSLHPKYSSSSEITHELGSVNGPSTSQFVNSYAFGDSNMQPIKASSLPVLPSTAEEMGTHGLSFSRSDPNVGDVALNRTGDAQINMQMVSCFKQYEPLRNGQMLSIHDKTTKNHMHPSPLGKHSENSEMKTSMVQLDVAGDTHDAGKLPPPSTLPPDFGGPDLSMTRSRKRKTATSNLLPWHTEFTESSKRLQSISIAEMEWAKAVNRLLEKEDYEVKMNEDVLPLLRPKKRLILTRQLMQLVFMPAPAVFLRAKAALSYDSVAYFSAELTLGDVCNLNSSSTNGTGLLCASDNMMTEESKANEKASEKHFLAIVENFTSRAEKMEANFQRLDKSASLLDVIVEYKELEKFSIINRFAKYHVRGPPRAAETSTSSDSTPNFPKPAPQRYVEALRARALPEKAQCLSL